jgi:rod shape-determining protein MreD
MRSADLTPLARDVMKLPASMGLVFFSLVIAFMLSVLPWSGAWLLARPDFVVLVLLFWALHEPRSAQDPRGSRRFAQGLEPARLDPMLEGVSQ